MEKIQSYPLLLPLLNFAVSLVLLAVWLRPAPSWGLRMFESETGPSIRLFVGCAVSLFTLAFEPTNLLKPELVTLNWEIVFGLFAVGALRTGALAFAQRPAAPATQVSANNAQIDSQNTTVTQSVKPEDSKGE